jgi:putative membrane protein insertion efficiency factor
MITFYQKYISPYYHALGRALFGNAFACRFSPTCSEYAKESYRRYGIIVGTKLSVYRFLRCQPFSQGGFDPVPTQKSIKPVKIK